MIKRNVFIIHGTAGNPQENWFPWLKTKLESEGHNVYVPQFPTPKGESLESWLKIINSYKKYLNKDSILIGHSKGGLFLLRLLERLKQPVFATFLVSAAIGIKPYQFYELNYKFAQGYDFDWKTIKTKSRHFCVYHSDDDPYTSIKNGEQIAKNLSIRLSFVPKAGHFNTRSGYVKFDSLFSDINELLI